MQHSSTDIMVYCVVISEQYNVWPANGSHSCTIIVGNRRIQEMELSESFTYTNSISREIAFDVAFLLINKVNGCLPMSK